LRTARTLVTRSTSQAAAAMLTMSRDGLGAIRLTGVGQRRSSRCLHVMHIVARGNAIKRFLPMGLPHTSQMP